MARAAKKPTQTQMATALDRAQQLTYDAWDAATTKRRLALARQALEISPYCADAHVLLAEHAKLGSDEELKHWREGVAAGEAALGKQGFAELAGQFWGFLETRPYMRARLGLAMSLWRRGQREEALKHLHDMLQLNPNDNQGVRYILASFLVDLHLDENLAALLKQYETDGSAAWTYTTALLAFRREGDTASCRQRLAKALKSNQFVPRYLLGFFNAIGCIQNQFTSTRFHAVATRLPPLV